MNLHRIQGGADWDHVSINDRSWIQTLAAKTHGVVSPANSISLIGLLVVIGGLWLLLLHMIWLGFTLLIGGRLLDIVDGMVADATRTKSPVGEIFDAVADKIGTFLTLIVLVLGHFASWWLLAALLAPQLLITIVIPLKRRQGKNVHPTRPGKLSMAALWVSVAGLIIEKGWHMPFIVLSILGVIIGLSILLGLIALYQYQAETEAATK